MPNNNNFFWRYLDLPFINGEIELDLAWLKECIISEISIATRIPGNQNANPPVQEAAAICSSCYIVS